MAEVRDTTGLSKEQAERAVEAVFGLITDALRRGEEVRIVGFGSFFVGTRAASPGRNPRTGERIELPPPKQPKFRAGTTLTDAVSSPPLQTPRPKMKGDEVPVPFLPIVSHSQRKQTDNTS